MLDNSVKHDLEYRVSAPYIHSKHLKDNEVSRKCLSTTISYIIILCMPRKHSSILSSLGQLTFIPKETMTDCLTVMSLLVPHVYQNNRRKT